MNRKHAALISFAVGLAVVAGSVAATKTIGLSHPARAADGPTPAAVAGRTKALDRAEVGLRKALAKRPPALPPLPAVAPAPAPSTAGAPLAARPSQPAPPQHVIYVRPAPRIVTIHRTGDDGNEAEDEDDGSSHERGDNGGFEGRDSSHEGGDDGGFDD